MFEIRDINIYGKNMYVENVGAVSSELFHDDQKRGKNGGTEMEEKRHNHGYPMRFETCLAEVLSADINRPGKPDTENKNGTPFSL